MLNQEIELNEEGVRVIPVHPLFPNVKVPVNTFVKLFSITQVSPKTEPTNRQILIQCTRKQCQRPHLSHQRTFPGALLQRGTFVGHPFWGEGPKTRQNESFCFAWSLSLSLSPSNSGKTERRTTWGSWKDFYQKEYLPFAEREKLPKRSRGTFKKWLTDLFRGS